MGISSFAALAGLLLVAACSGNEFSAANGENAGGSGGEGAISSGAGGTSAGTGGASGGAGAGVGFGGGGAGSVIDASVTGGSGGHPAVDASHPPDVSGGSGGVSPVDARADVGPPETGPAPSCPKAEPTLLGACTGALKCTYGTHPRIACRKTYTCSGGQWSLGASQMCPDLAACQPPYPQVNFSCTTAGQDCSFDPLYCRCLACPDMGCPKWNCFPTSPAGCPTTPPNLGQPCDASATSPVCEFGDCSLGTRVSVACVNGFINWTFPNCQ